MIQPASPNSGNHSTGKPPLSAYRGVAMLPVAPALIIPGLLWIQWRFTALHPADVARWHPTLSGALNDQTVSDPFEILLFATTPFLIIAVWLVIRYYWIMADRLLSGGSPWRRNFWRGYVLLAGLLQLMAAIGMLMVVHYPSHTSSGPHVLGSYMLFAGHAISIMLSGYLSRQLARTPGAGRQGAPWQKRQARRWPISLLIAALAISYALLFYAPRHLEFLNNHSHSVFVAVLEILMLSMFLTYLLGFVRDLIQLVGEEYADQKPQEAS
jgi:hypothetical protein